LGIQSTFLPILAQTPEDAPEEAEDAAGVALAGGEAAEQETEVMAVGGLHGAGRVAGGFHGVLNDRSEEGKIGGACAAGRGGGEGFGWKDGWGGEGARGEFVETDGGGLSEIHGGLAGIGGDFNEDVAPGEVFAGEAVFFRSEDESYSATAG